MKFNIPKIVKSIALGEYDESLSEQTIWMWVNPPKKMRQEFDEIQKGIREQVTELMDYLSDDEKSVLQEKLKSDITDKEKREISNQLQGATTKDEAEKIKKVIEKLQAENAAWWAEMWSQGEEEETHWSVEDVEQLLSACADTDPHLWEFLIETGLDLLKAHIVGERKK